MHFARLAPAGSAADPCMVLAGAGHGPSFAAGRDANSGGGRETHAGAQVATRRDSKFSFIPADRACLTTLKQRPEGQL